MNDEMEQNDTRVDEFRLQLEIGRVGRVGQLSGVQRFQLLMNTDKLSAAAGLFF